MCAEGDCKKMIVEHGKSPEPCKIKLIKMAKSYGWEVSFAGNNFEDIKNEIDKLNKQMEATYGGFKE